MTIRNNLATRSSRSIAAARLSAATLALTLLTVGCSGSGGASPTAPQSLETVSTPWGQVTVRHYAPLTDADRQAIAREVDEGYRRADRQLAAVGSVGTSSFYITTENLEPGWAGSYGGGEIRTRPDWRAVDHELQHHFCDTLKPTGVDCSIVDHCSGTDLAGVPMSTHSNCSSAQG